VDRGYGFGVIARTVKFRHAHTAEAQGRNLLTMCAELAKLQVSPQRWFQILDEWLRCWGT
jgi:hypothetical protein